MQAQIMLMLGRLLLNWFKKHPDAVDQFMDQVAKRIPGTLDDTALKFLRFVGAMFKNLS